MPLTDAEAERIAFLRAALSRYEKTGESPWTGSRRMQIDAACQDVQLLLRALRAILLEGDD